MAEGCGFEIVFAISNPQSQKLLCRNDFSFFTIRLFAVFLSIFLSLCVIFGEGEKLLLMYGCLCEKFVLNTELSRRVYCVQMSRNHVVCENTQP